MDISKRIEGGFFGLVVGDALGVPVEFVQRDWLKAKPVAGMLGHGTHKQPAGTWSDDTSMVLATIDALEQGFSPNLVLDRFCEWLYEDKYTPRGQVFDVGTTTSMALDHYKTYGAPLAEYDEFTNGNGSLMRILPASIAFHKRSDKEIVRISSELSALTHGHPRSCIACAYHSLLIKHLLQGKDLRSAYSSANKDIADFMPAGESANFARITGGKIADLVENQIRSSGYVIHTLEAAIWCCLTTSSFKDAVLKAVNLGEDTDTVGAVAGGLAGTYYGVDAILSEWIAALAKLDGLKESCDKLAKLSSSE